MTKEEETKNAIDERIAEIEMVTFMTNEFDDEIINSLDDETLKELRTSFKKLLSNAPKLKMLSMIVKLVGPELSERFGKAIEESNTTLTNVLKRIDEKLVGTTTINNIIKND